MQSRVNHDGSLVLQMGKTENGDFLFGRQFPWHKVKSAASTYQREAAEQLVCSGTNQTFKIKLSFLWLQYLLRVFSSHRFISPPVNSMLWWKLIWDQKPINQLQFIGILLWALLYARCMLIACFRHRKVSHLQISYYLSVQNRFLFKVKVLKAERSPAQSPYHSLLYYFLSPLSLASPPSFFLLILLCTFCLLFAPPNQNL